ncbi:MAG TPA: PASTA domain-containing protein, partial [Nocardioides sp.]|nr:PASTA domain-containing protein [Nocardioides sp.]
GAVPPAAAAPIPRLDTAAPYSGRDEERRDRGPWLALGLVAAFVLIAVLLAYLLLHGNGGGTPATYQTTPATHATKRSSAPTTPTSSATTDNVIQLDAADYVGRDFHVVDTELSGKGLNVQLQPQANDGTHTAGIVTQISPSGAVTKGQIITVTYWDNPPTSSAPTTPATTPTTAPTTPATGAGSASALDAPPLLDQKPEGPSE